MAALYAAARWVLHFAELGMWVQAAGVCVGALVLLVAARLKVPLALFLLAIAIGLGSTILLGGFDALLP